MVQWFERQKDAYRVGEMAQQVMLALQIRGQEFLPQKPI